MQEECEAEDQVRDGCMILLEDGEDDQPYRASDGEWEELVDASDPRNGELRRAWLVGGHTLIFPPLGSDFNVAH